MAYHRGQNSTFEFDVVVYKFYKSTSRVEKIANLNVQLQI